MYVRVVCVLEYVLFVVLLEHYILRLEVVVGQTVRMNSCECLQYLNRQRLDVLDAQLQRALVQQCTYILVQQLEHQRGKLTHATVAYHSYNVRVLLPQQRAFILKVLFVLEHLDRDRHAVQLALVHLRLSTACQ